MHRAFIHSFIHSLNPLCAVWCLRRWQGSATCVCQLLLRVLCRVRHLFLSSRSTVRRHVSFGRPRFLFPCGVYLSAALGSGSGGILQTWPSHLHLLKAMVSAMLFAPALPRSSMFVIMFGQKTFMIRCRRLFWKTSSLRSMVAVVFQHSDPYRRTLSTLLLKMRSLVCMLRHVVLQMGFSIAKAWLALLILVLISLAQSPSVVTLLPR